MSRRALVAYAARRARRVQPLYVGKQQHVVAVNQAIEVAEDFARGRTASGVEKVTAAAKVAARAASDASAANAAYAAANAAYAAHVKVAAYASYAANAKSAAYAAANAAADATNAAYDYHRLLELRPEPAPALGDPIDLTLLGPLWPAGEPEWFAASPFSQQCGDAQLTVTIEVPDDASDDDVVAAIAELTARTDNLYRALGGSGLKIAKLDIHEEARVPAGASE